jgi:hypothetical protein
VASKADTIEDPKVGLDPPAMATRMIDDPAEETSKVLLSISGDFEAVIYYGTLGLSYEVGVGTHDVTILILYKISSAA